MSNEANGLATIESEGIQGGLTTREGNLLPFVAPENPELVAKYSSGGGGFLPMLTFATGNSTVVKQKKIGADHYGLKINKELKDLGESVIVIPQAWRFSASASEPIAGSQKKSYHAVYDEQGAKAQEYKAKADVKGCRTHYYGYDVLVWIPEESCYAILAFNNKTARNTFPDIYKDADNHKMGRAVLLGWQEIDTGEYQYNAMSVKSYMGQVSVLPSSVDLKDALAKFPTKGESKSQEDSAPEGVETVDGAAAGPTRG